MDTDSIFYAAFSGDVRRLREYLSSGGDVNMKDSYDRIPLHWAAFGGEVNAMALLLRSGASLEATSQEGCVALLYAAACKSVDGMALLLDWGADVDITDEEGCTALHYVAKMGGIDALSFLLDVGACVNTLNKEGSTALHWAASDGHVNAVAVLLDSGADVGITNHGGWTALHSAASRGHSEVVALFLDRGANVSAYTSFGRETALDIAVRRNEAKVCLTIRTFLCNTSEEWRPRRHMLFPRPFRSAVATVLALWSWNSMMRAHWHVESPFHVLSLELVFEIFIRLAADVPNHGFVVAPLSSRPVAQRKTRNERVRHVDSKQCPQ